VNSPVPNRPKGTVYPGFQRRLWKSASVDGARSLRVRSWLIGERRRAVDRILDNLTFGLGSAAALLVHSRPNVVVIETWPILAAATVVGDCVLRGIPVGNYIKDIFPEAATAAGPPERDAAALVRDHDLGVVVPPENPTMLAEAIEWMAA
jgi:hypothetical protein